MDFRAYRIAKDDSGRRIDRVIRRFLPNIPLSGVYRLLRKGLVRIDGKRVSPDFLVAEGSELSIATCAGEENQAPTTRPESPLSSQYGSNAAIETILETEDLLFVNKPKGISTHGDGGLSSLVSPSTAEENSLSFRSGPLHRLDKDTSGLVTFSRSLAGARWFSEAIQSRRLEKYYLGVVRGTLDSAREWRDLAADGKELVTLAFPLAIGERGGNALTLARFKLVTGRKHQIRIQAADHGFPLAGDSRYGGGASIGDGSYLLHAWQLVFPDDRLPRVPAVIRAPLPTAFASCVSAFFGDSALAHIENGELYWSEHDELQ